MTPEEKNIEKWNQHVRDSKDRAFYSIQRIDLLTISLSGGGIIVVFEILKYFSEHRELAHNLTFLKVIGGVFALAIVLNFLSQLTGQKTNECEERFAKERLKKYECPNVYEEKKEAEYDSKSGWFHKCTSCLTGGGIILVLIGIICLVIFSHMAFNLIS